MDDRNPGQRIERELGVDITNCDNSSLFVFIDEFLFIYRMAGYYFFSGITNDKDGQALMSARMCELSFTHLSAIRVLSAMGLDAAARSHLRHLYETNILWLRLRVDSAALKEFTKCTTPERSNKFWHEYISRNKTENFLTEYLSRRGKYFLPDGEPFDTIKKVMGLSSHPSFLSAYFALLNHWQRPLDDNAVFLGANASTAFTLSSAIHTSIIPFSLIERPIETFICLNLFDPKMIYPTHSIANDWTDYSQKIQEMPLRLWLMANRFLEEFPKSNIEFSNRRR